MRNEDKIIQRIDELEGSLNFKLLWSFSTLGLFMSMILMISLLF